MARWTLPPHTLSRYAWPPRVTPPHRRLNGNLTRRFISVLLQKRRGPTTATARVPINASSFCGVVRILIDHLEKISRCSRTSVQTNAKPQCSISHSKYHVVVEKRRVRIIYFAHKTNSLEQSIIDLAQNIMIRILKLYYN